MTHREALDRLFEAWHSGDALRAVAHFASDATYREAGRAPLSGRDAIARHFTTFFRDGPRWQLHVDDVLIDGDGAAVRYRFAVAQGDSEGWLERSGCAFVRFAAGTIVEWREYEG